MIFVFAVQTVGRHFIARMVPQDSHRTVRNAGVYRMRKQAFHLRRACRSRNIPVLRLTSHKRIPYAAAHRIGLKPRLLQDPNDACHRLRQRNSFIPLHNILPHYRDTIFVSQNRDFVKFPALPLAYKYAFIPSRSHSSSLMIRLQRFFDFSSAARYLLRYFSSDFTPISQPSVIRSAIVLSESCIAIL